MEKYHITISKDIFIDEDTSFIVDDQIIRKNNGEEFIDYLRRICELSEKTKIRFEEESMNLLNINDFEFSSPGNIDKDKENEDNIMGFAKMF